MAPTQQVIPVESRSSTTRGAGDADAGGSSRAGSSSKLAPRRISAIYLLGLFIVLFGLLSPDTFLTEVTFTLIFRSGVVTCILALAFLVPLTAGVYDLSIGAVMALSLGLVVYLSLHTGLPDAGDRTDRDRRLPRCAGRCPGSSWSSCTSTRSSRRSASARCSPAPCC